MLGRPELLRELVKLRQIFRDAGAPDHLEEYITNAIMGGVENVPLYTVELHNWCRESRATAKLNEERAAEMAARLLEESI